LYLERRSAAAALFLVVPAAFWPFNPASWLAAAAAALGLLVARDFLTALKPESLRVRIEGPSVVGVGDEGELKIHMYNPASKPLKLAVHIQAPLPAGLAQKRRRLVLPARSWSRLDVAFRPAARGNLTIGPLTVRIAGAWGLCGRQQSLSYEFRVKVYPALPGRRQAELRLSQARTSRSGIRASAVKGQGSDFDSLREYHPDDEFRRINWKATARAGKPISNTFREERNQRVLILMDAGRTMATSIGGFTRFEYAIDTCVALAELAAGMGDQVGMIVFGKDTLSVVAPKGGKAQVRTIVDRVFNRYPTLDASNYRSAFGTLLAQFSRRALLVLLTELSEQSAMSSLFGSMPALVKRHLVMVAAMTDPAVLSLARVSPVDSQEAYLKAAAASAIADRQQSAARLRAMGASVVDEGPGELAGKVAGEYLRIKAAGRL